MWRPPPPGQAMARVRTAAGCRSGPRDAVTAARPVTATAHPQVPPATCCPHHPPAPHKKPSSARGAHGHRVNNALTGAAPHDRSRGPYPREDADQSAMRRPCQWVEAAAGGRPGGIVFARGGTRFVPARCSTVAARRDPRRDGEGRWPGQARSGQSIRSQGVAMR